MVKERVEIMEIRVNFRRRYQDKNSTDKYSSHALKLKACVNSNGKPRG